MAAQMRNNLQLTEDEHEELVAVFQSMDTNRNGTINISELSEALGRVGLKLPPCDVRRLIQEYDIISKDECLDLNEFRLLYGLLKNTYDLGSRFRNVLASRSGLDNYGGMCATSSEGTTHTVRKEEQIAFSNWINRNLADDADCSRYLPINADGRDLYVKCDDGVIYCNGLKISPKCRKSLSAVVTFTTMKKDSLDSLLVALLAQNKLINRSQPNTIDERAINKGKLSIYHMHENLTLALNSARAIGCNIINIGTEDLKAGKPHLVLGLLWQIIRIGLLSDINLHEHPGLVLLLRDGENLEEIMTLTPEDMLIRWVNYHLGRTPAGVRITNFSSDIKDSLAYIHLLNQIAPRDSQISTLAQNEPDLLRRAERMLEEAEKLGVRSFVSAADIVQGVEKLNLAFVANLFNVYPAIDNGHYSDIDFSPIQEETREERMYRNWMNSLGVSPYVHHLYSDLTNGLIIFQLYDIIKPGIVDWSKVIKNFNKMRMLMEKIGNCNYAVLLGKQCKFSLVGIDGKDLYDGNPTLTLALVWQLMKAYTLTVLSKLTKSNDGNPIVEKEIVDWVNQKLATGGKKSKISGFNDPSIADSHAIIDLVDACKPGSVNYDLVKNGPLQQDRIDNAKYAISMARKIGAHIYALPEDIIEVKSKMVMTIFACLMIKDFQPAVVSSAQAKRRF